ncbi:MAG: hypothetical protein ABEI75_05165 [Halobaculum sp.]
MSYSVVDSRYQGDTGGSHVLEVNVMREQSADTDYWDKQYQFVLDALDQAYSGDYVPATIARKYDTDADLDCNDLLNSGNNWLDNNLSGYDGMYLWVADCSNTPFACCHESGWDGRHQGFTMTGTYPTVTETATTGVMEALHPYLYNFSCPDVQNEANGDEDHALGQRTYYYKSKHEITPMLGHYDKATAQTGDCDNWEDDAEFTANLTYCTLVSLEYSWNHDAGNHSH